MNTCSKHLLSVLSTIHTEEISSEELSVVDPDSPETAMGILQAHSINVMASGDKNE